MADEIIADLDLGYAIVRVHAGKRTEQERKEAIINAAKAFAESIIKSGYSLDEVCNVRRDSVNADVVNSPRLGHGESGKARTGAKKRSQYDTEYNNSTAYLL